MVNEIIKFNLKRQCRVQLIFLFLSALLATFMWVYYLSQGFTMPGILDGFIDLQAYALQKGQLAIKPDYHDIFYYDVSLYKGNYYFYWGLLPSALHAFLSTFLGRTISSYLLVFLFLFLFFFYFQRIIFEIMHTATQASSLQNGFITCATIILSWILIFNIPDLYHDKFWYFGRFLIYEQQIMFGMGIAMPGLFYLIKGQKENNPILLITAACLFAAAAWVRGTWFVFSIVVIPVIFGALMKQKKLRSFLKWPHYAFMMVPVLLIGGLLALNFARFDDFFDFGLKLQNPMLSSYFRLQNGLFSAMTHFFNIAYKMLAYYTSPELIRLSGLELKSASWSEGVKPCLFYNNPMLLVLVPLVLYGIYRAFHVNKNMRNIIIAVGSMAIIINGVIMFAGNIVTMRYFVECYYVTMLLFIAGLVVVLPVKVSLPILVIVLSIYLPGNIKAFLVTRPELRLIKIVESKQDNVDSISISPIRSISKKKTYYIFNDAHWHEGSVTASQRGTFTYYNTIGMIPLQNGMIGAADLAAVYIKPQKSKELLKNRALLEFIGIKSVSKPGRIRVYVEKTKVVEFNIVPDKARTYRTQINYNLKDDAPHRLLIYFFEENTFYLPAKQGNQPAFLFEAIRLSHL